MADAQGAKFEPNIKSLWTQVSRTRLGLFDLINPSFIKSPFPLNNYIVPREFEMRIDLVMKDIYQLNNGWEIMEHVDVILFINDIDNPLNIKAGDVIQYPDYGNLDNFRTNDEVLRESRYNRNDVQKKLLTPNKSTKKDSSRETFKKNNYSVPPTVQNVPKDPIRITPDGKFSIGGI